MKYMVIGRPKGAMDRFWVTYENAIFPNVYDATTFIQMEQTNLPGGEDMEFNIVEVHQKREVEKPTKNFKSSKKT